MNLLELRDELGEIPARWDDREQDGGLFQARTVDIRYGNMEDANDLADSLVDLMTSVAAGQSHQDMHITCIIGRLL